MLLGLQQQGRRGAVQAGAGTQAILHFHQVLQVVQEPRVDLGPLVDVRHRLHAVPNGTDKIT